MQDTYSPKFCRFITWNTKSASNGAFDAQSRRPRSYPGFSRRSEANLLQRSLLDYSITTTRITIRDSLNLPMCSAMAHLAKLQSELIDATSIMLCFASRGNDYSPPNSMDYGSCVFTKTTTIGSLNYAITWFSLRVLEGVHTLDYWIGSAHICFHDWTVDW